MREDWKFDRESLIDSCLNHDLIDKFGFEILRELVIVELRDVKRAPRIATYVHLIDGEPVYLRLIGKGLARGRPRPALMLAYTLYKRTIEPLWLFQASEEIRTEEHQLEVLDSGPLAPRWLEGAPRAKSHSDAPLSEPVERELERVVRDARRRRNN